MRERRKQREESYLIGYSLSGCCLIWESLIRHLKLVALKCSSFLAISAFTEINWLGFWSAYIGCQDIRTSSV